MKFIGLLCVVGFVGLCQVKALNIGFGDIFKSVGDVATGVAKDAANLVPTPEGIFDLSKQLLVGYPFEVVSDAVNKICSSALSSSKVLPKILPDINKMQFQLRTACNKHSFPLLKADEMWKSPDFDKNKKVVILATGWTTTINETSTIDAFAKAYNCRGDFNFVAIDAASFVDTLYTWSALNTEDIGKYVAEGLARLADIVPVENIHLIGHSLGAHIVGSAARNFNYLTGKLIPRITGLDPAKPCFNEGENLSGLLRGDADFIDVIHSNPGVLGKRDPMGDVDFYPGGLDPLPKGCATVVCAHARAWEYYEETIYPGNERNFLGARCGSLTKLRDNKCPGGFYPMGFDVPQDIKGNYFLEVNGNMPYGKNSNAKTNAAHESCGLCPTKSVK